MESKKLIVEAGSSAYQINFRQIQLEITGRCNMSCRHCRAANELKQDVPISQIKKVVDFARMFRGNRSEVIVSGGEPLMHRNFADVLTCIREAGNEVVVMTTNGSLVQEKHLRLISDLSFRKFVFSVSLDSLSPKIHDQFRGCKGSYASAVKAIRMVSKYKSRKLFLSLRVTVLPEQLNSMDKFAEFAFRNGCDIVSFSAVYPVGRARQDPSIWMSSAEKKLFLEKIRKLSMQYHGKSFIVNTNDPLKNLIGSYAKAGNREKCGKLALDGCVAGLTTFNLCSNGDLTPCALLEMPFMNVFNLTVSQISHEYSQSEIIKNLLDIEAGLKGKCSACEMKKNCRGGCRARALGRTGDYLTEDPECWMH